MHENVRPLHAGLFSRDGHLTMLSLDRFEAGELSTPMCETVIDHVEACDRCAHRVASMRADAVSLQPPAHLIAGRATPGRAIQESQRSLGTLAIAGTVAAAAALLIMALPEPQQIEQSGPQEATLTASPYTTTAEPEGAAMFAPALDFSVVESPSDDRADHLDHGDRVSWDTAVVLHVSPHEAGYVAVVSATTPRVLGAPDELADTDGCQDEHEQEILVLMPVTRLSAHSGPHALRVDHAGRLATEVADEQLMAIYCEESFELDDPFDPDLPSLREDCTSVEVMLTRFDEVTDS